MASSPAKRGRVGEGVFLPALALVEADPLLAELFQAAGVLHREGFLAEALDLSGRGTCAAQAVADRAHEGIPVPAPDGDTDIRIDWRHGRHHPSTRITIGRPDLFQPSSIISLPGPEWGDKEVKAVRALARPVPIL